MVQIHLRPDDVATTPQEEGPVLAAAERSPKLVG